MLVYVGGFLGSGRKDFTQRLGERLGFYVYDLESSMRTSLLMREYRREKTNGDDTLSDALRLRMFQHVARDFGHLSKVFKNIIIDEPFHRDIPRTYLLQQGKKHFSRTAFVWVEETEASVEERVLRVLRKNPRHNTETVRRIMERMDLDFEPFTSPVLVAQNVTQDKSVLEEVVRGLTFIQSPFRYENIRVFK